jgi:hypothetical protein
MLPWLALVIPSGIISQPKILNHLKMVNPVVPVLLNICQFATDTGTLLGYNRGIVRVNKVNEES